MLLLVKVRCLFLFTQFCDMLCFLAVIPTVCSDLPTPTNGESVGYNNMGTMNNRPVGAVATHSCADGYMLNGEATRTCQSTGMWNGSEPSCDCE